MKGEERRKRKEMRQEEGRRWDGRRREEKERRKEEQVGDGRQEQYSHRKKSRALALHLSAASHNASTSRRAFFSYNPNRVGSIRMSQVDSWVRPIPPFLLFQWPTRLARPNLGYKITQSYGPNYNFNNLVPIPKQLDHNIQIICTLKPSLSN